MFSAPFKVVTVKQYQCCRCGHGWQARNKKQVPMRCGKCKSPYWNVPKKGAEAPGSTEFEEV